MSLGATLVAPRSIVPGRHRWDIGAVLNRPDLAARFDAAMARTPGIVMARANPVTGRALVRHDASLATGEVAQLVRRAAAQLDISVVVPAPAGNGIRPARVLAPKRRKRKLVRIALAACGVLAGAPVLFRSPLLRLGVILAATGAIVVVAWKRSRQRAEAAEGGRKRTIRRPIRTILRSRKGRFRGLAILTVVGYILLILPAGLVGIMSAVVTKGPVELLVRLGLTTGLSQLLALGATTALVSLVSAFTSYVAGLGWRDLAQALQHEWRVEMYAHVQRAEMRSLDLERITRLSGVLTADIDQLGQFLSGPVADLLGAATSLVVLLGVFYVTAPTIAWLVFLPMPVIAWLSFRYQERSGPALASASESTSLLTGHILNSLEASATIKSFAAEEHEIDRVRVLSRRQRETRHRADADTTAFSQSVQVAGVSSYVGIMLLGGLKVLQGSMSFEIYNTLIGFPLMLLGRLPGLAGAVEQYQRTVSALGRVMELRGLPVESWREGIALDTATVRGAISLERVTFAYPGREPVLREFSMDIPAGSTTGIVGVTGAGKTTIARLLLRLQDVQDGRVTLDGVDLRDLRLPDLRGAIGFVGQDAFLFQGTVADNIRYGTFSAPIEDVVAAARIAEAHEFIEALPQRYDTIVGERGTGLSGGQRQRVSLARAILKGAPILLLDEATSAVDNETEAAIQRALEDFSHNRTLVMVAHRLSTIRHADRIYVMGAEGRMAEAGTHQELLGRDGIYAALWRLQIGDTG